MSSLLGVLVSRQETAALVYGGGEGGGGGEEEEGSGQVRLDSPPSEEAVMDQRGAQTQTFESTQKATAGRERTPLRFGFYKQGSKH